MAGGAVVYHSLAEERAQRKTPKRGKVGTTPGAFQVVHTDLGNLWTPNAKTPGAHVPEVMGSRGHFPPRPSTVPASMPSHVATPPPGSTSSHIPASLLQKARGGPSRPRIPGSAKGTTDRRRRPHTARQERSADGAWHHSQTRERLAHLYSQPGCTCGYGGTNLSFLFRKPPGDHEDESLPRTCTLHGDGHVNLDPADFFIRTLRAVRSPDVAPGTHGAKLIANDGPVEFPSLRPSGRDDVLRLAKAVDDLGKQLSDTVVDNGWAVREEDSWASESGSIPPLPEVSDSTDMHVLLEIIKEEQRIYNLAFHELIRQVTVECADRGALLARIRERYASLFARVPSRVRGMFADLDAVTALARDLGRETALLRAKEEEQQGQIRTLKKANEAYIVSQKGMHMKVVEASHCQEQAGALLEGYHALYEMQRSRLESELTKTRLEAGLWLQAAEALLGRSDHSRAIVNLKDFSELREAEEMWQQAVHDLAMMLKKEYDLTVAKLTGERNDWKDTINRINASVVAADTKSGHAISRLVSSMRMWCAKLRSAADAMEPTNVAHMSEAEAMELLREVGVNVVECIRTCYAAGARYNGEAAVNIEDEVLHVRREMISWRDTAAALIERFESSGRVEGDQGFLPVLDQHYCTANEWTTSIETVVKGDSGLVGLLASVTASLEDLSDTVSRRLLKDSCVTRNDVFSLYKKYQALAVEAERVGALHEKHLTDSVGFDQSVLTPLMRWFEQLDSRCRDDAAVLEESFKKAHHDANAWLVALVLVEQGDENAQTAVHSALSALLSAGELATKRVCDRFAADATRHYALDEALALLKTWSDRATEIASTLATGDDDIETHNGITLVEAVLPPPPPPATPAVVVKASALTPSSNATSVVPALALDTSEQNRNTTSQQGNTTSEQRKSSLNKLSTKRRGSKSKKRRRGSILVQQVDELQFNPCQSPRGLVHRSYASSLINTSNVETRDPRTCTWTVRFIREIFRVKIDLDRQDDEEKLPRDRLADVVYEFFRGKYNMKPLLDQYFHDALVSVQAHRNANEEVELFAQFLEESRPLEELSFFLFAWLCAMDSDVGMLLPSSEDAVLAPYVCMVRAGAVCARALIGFPETEKAKAWKSIEDASIPATFLLDDAYTVPVEMMGDDENDLQLARNRRIKLITLMNLLLDQYKDAQKIHLERLEKLFRLADIDGDGELSVAEFHRIVLKLDQKKSSRQTAKIYREALANNANRIMDFKSFLLASKLLGFDPDGEKTLPRSGVERPKLVKCVKDHWGNFKATFNSFVTTIPDEDQGMVAVLLSMKDQLELELGDDDSSTDVVATYRQLLRLVHERICHLHDRDQGNLSKLGREFDAVQESIRRRILQEDKKPHVPRAPPSRSRPASRSHVPRQRPSSAASTGRASRRVMSGSRLTFAREVAATLNTPRRGFGRSTSASSLARPPYSNHVGSHPDAVSSRAGPPRSVGGSPRSHQGSPPLDLHLLKMAREAQTSPTQQLVDSLVDDGLQDLLNRINDTTVEAD